MNFKMPGKVYRTAMSTLATSHMLIAAATEDVQVRLCDIASGAFSHTLSGHRGMLRVAVLTFFFFSRYSCWSWVIVYCNFWFVCIEWLSYILTSLGRDALLSQGITFLFSSFET